MSNGPIRSIVLEALKLTETSDRANFVSLRCGHDTQLRRHVEQALEAARRGTATPMDGAREAATQSSSIPSPNIATGELDIAVGEMIGRYQIRELLAEGGMGVVYVAEQLQPVRRKVALKVIRPGMATKSALARFEAERQALAMMDHPCIARVFDGGATPCGQPYFVMEFVPGIPITAFFDEHQVGIEKRLQTMIDVCLAVQHAHQKGIIHRDLKPSNVLVAEIDGEIVPKVIDFGVAKAIDQQLGCQTVYTQFMQMVGTPLYMSPEQASSGAVDVDTQSDVYSLGVLLYEVLTGKTPFGHQDLKRADPERIRHLIRDVEPKRPSAMVQTLEKKDLSKISMERQCPSDRLGLGLKGELDWVVMKALEKDRTRRYDSAQALADDLRRFLRNEPVAAHPPSKWYLFSKIVRRFWQPILAASLLFLALLAGGVTSTVLMFKAVDAEDKANLAEEAAEARAEEIRYLLYASEMVLASQDWRKGDVQAARKRLERHIPKGDELDLRGFEWHLLWKQQEVELVEIDNIGAAIYDLELSRDGTQFAAAGADGMIRGYDVQSLELKWTIDSEQGETNGVAFSPNGGRLAAVGDDGTLRVWELDSEVELFCVKAHDGLAYQVAFLPDSDLLVTCGTEKQVKLWNADTGDFVGPLNTHPESLETLEANKQGLVAAACEDSEVTVFDAVGNRELWRFRNRHAHAVSSLAFSCRGDLAYATVDGLLSVRNLEDDAWSYQRRLSDGIRSLAFFPHGLSLAVGDHSGNLRIMPVERGVWETAASRVWRAHEGRIYTLLATPDGQRVISAGKDGLLKCWTPFDASSRRTIRSRAPCTNFAIVGQDRIALGCHNEVTIHDLQGRLLHRILRSSSTPQVGDFWHVSWASEANMVVAAARREIVAWDISSAEQQFVIEVEPEVTVTEFAATPNAELVFYVTKHVEGGKELRLWDSTNQTEVILFDTRSALSMGMSPDGRWLVFDSNNELCMLDVETRKVTQSWHAHEAGIRDLQFSDNGLLGTVSLDRTLKLWSLPDGEPSFSAIAHQTDSRRLAISADGKRIATGGYDRMLRVWDGKVEHPLWEYATDTGRVRDLEFTLDGQQLISLCNDHELVIFDATPMK